MTNIQEPFVGAKWKKANGSLETNCVEVAFGEGGAVGVRDSKNPGGPILSFTADEWDAFAAGAKDGEFDRPAE